jgi:hypothetical protein
MCPRLNAYDAYLCKLPAGLAKVLGERRLAESKEKLCRRACLGRPWSSIGERERNQPMATCHRRHGQTPRSWIQFWRIVMEVANGLLFAVSTVNKLRELKAQARSRIRLIFGAS